jgi:hypothetical protein
VKKWAQDHIQKTSSFFLNVQININLGSIKMGKLANIIIIQRWAIISFLG